MPRARIESLESRQLMAGTVLVGRDVTEGTLSAIGDTQRVPFTLEAPGWVNAHVSPQAGSTNQLSLRVLRATGQPIVGSSGAQLDSPLVQPGDYQLEIRRVALAPRDQNGARQNGFSLTYAADYAGSTFADVREGGTLTGAKTFEDFSGPIPSVSADKIDMYHFVLTDPSRLGISVSGLDGKMHRLVIFQDIDGNGKVRSDEQIGSVKGTRKLTFSSTASAGQLYVALVSEYATDAVPSQYLIKVAAAKPNLGLEVHNTAYRPQSNSFHFSNHPIPDGQTIGIRLNGDDDNNNTIPDRDDMDSAPADDDLIRVDLSVMKGTLPKGFRFVLRSSNPALRVWSTQDKGHTLLTRSEATLNLETNLTMWVEWIGLTQGAGTMELWVQDATGRDMMELSTLSFKTIQNSVVVFGGLGQTPQDAPQVDYGSFAIGKTLYDEGYDVHLYDQGIGVGLSAESSAAYREIATAVNLRGVTDVAIFGYSYGGGATYNLSKFLAQGRSAGQIQPFNLALAVYIDAIVQYQTGSQTNRPVNAIKAVNYYEQNSAGSNGVTGALVAGAINIPISRQPWGANATHLTIDDLPRIGNDLRARLKSAIPL